MESKDGQYVNRISALEKKVDGLDDGDDSNYFKLDEENTATEANTFDGETTFNETVTMERGSGTHTILGDTALGAGSDQFDYRGKTVNSTNLVNKGYVDDADAELQQAIERLEGVTHRTEWVLKPINASDPVGPGEMTWRDPGGMGWAGVLQVRINHEDLGGRVHPMETIQESNLWLIEYADENDVIQGSAVYIVGTIRSNTEWIDFDPSSMVHASGQPPQLDTDQVMKLVFTPADSGSGSYYTKAESDQKFIAKVGSNLNFVLDNGGRTGMSNYHAKNYTNGGNYFLTANHVEVLKSDYHKKTNSTDVLLSNHTTVTQDSFVAKTASNKKVLQADGSIGPVQFTKDSYGNLFWS